MDIQHCKYSKTVYHRRCKTGSEPTVVGATCTREEMEVVSKGINEIEILKQKQLKLGAVLLF